LESDGESAARPASVDDGTQASPARAVDEALEREYNLRIRHPERGAAYDDYRRRSVALRERETEHRARRYGEAANCVIDFFPARVVAPAPLFVFIHGGYWRALDRGIFSFLARPWLDRGVHVAMPGYDLAPAVSVRAIADQIHAALDGLLGDAAALQIDATRCIVGGHSAGAHLGALVLSEKRKGSAIGFVGVSGIYALAPLLSTSINFDVRLDADEARALSPSPARADRATRYLCAVGGAETDGFRRQTHDYVAALRERGCHARSLEVPGRTHFDVLDDLADADAGLFRSAFALLSPA